MSGKQPKAKNNRLADWIKLDSAIDKVLSDDNVTTPEAFYQKLNNLPELEPMALLLSSGDSRDHLFETGLAGVVPDLIDLSVSQESDLDEGTLLSRYRIVEAIGSGGMGTVYLAERADGLYEKQVALKIMSTGLADPVLRERFRRERQIQAELSHPGIAKLLDAGVAEGDRPWYVLDYIQGVSLTSYCNQHELAQEERLEIFVKLCDAIEYAHAHGVIHRDLKPSNILVEKKSSGAQPIVLDFGIASKRDDVDLTKAGKVVSTPAYSAPEQAKGDAIDLDQRADIFSLGILLYELIDDRRPFVGDSYTEISYQVSHQETPALITSGVSSDLSAIILKCLYKSPEERYQSVSGLIADLENFKQGRSVQANPVGRWFRFKRYVVRHPLLSLALATTAVILLAMLSFSIWQSISKREYAADQARVIQHFGDAAREIESSSKLIYSRPVHNVEKELQVLDNKFHALVAEMGAVDPAIRPIVAHVLGQAAASIEHLQEAQDFLENAWNGGMQEPIVALELGRVYLRLYADAVQYLNQFSHADVRAKALQEAGQTYLQPARFYMQKGVSDKHEEAIVAKALLQYLDGNVVAAIGLLDELVEKSTWPAVALVEAGNIYLQDGESNLLATDYEQALDSLSKAFNYYSKGAQIARSHPMAIKGQCAAWTKIAQMGAIYGEALPLTDLDDIASCNQLITIHPTSVEALLQAAWDRRLLWDRHIIIRTDTS